MAIIIVHRLVVVLSLLSVLVSAHMNMKTPEHLNHRDNTYRPSDKIPEQYYNFSSVTGQTFPAKDTSILQARQKVLQLSSGRRVKVICLSWKDQVLITEGAVMPALTADQQTKIQPYNFP
ncbi:hypothetical protein BDZ91DRAFT_826199 [Kalaharituber pfeilii]|nr:hypothetical protein BDZ91DRAFT_826199 [Kalaharituber pfeilii]